MPTPNTYYKLALKLSPHKWTVLGIAGLGFAVSLMSILAASQFHKVRLYYIDLELGPFSCY
jgi:hypothetical protein